MKQHKLVTEARISEILSCYGASPQAWPVAERIAAQKLIAQSTELQKMQSIQTELDTLLAQDKNSQRYDSNALASRILASLPEQKQASKNPLLSRLAGLLTIPTLVPLAAVFVAVVSLVLLNTPTRLPAEPDPVFVSWAWEDITGQTINDDTRIEMGFMDLVELETTDTSL